MNLKDFSLLKEDDDHYVIGHPKGKSLRVPKSGLNEKAQKLIQGLKREQGLAEGTPDGTEIEPVVGPTPSMVTAALEKGNAIDPGAAVPIAQSPAQIQPPQAAGPQAPVAEPEAAPAPQAAPNPFTSHAPETIKGLEEGQKILAESAHAQEKAGKQEAQAYQTYANQVQAQQKIFADKQAEYQKKDQAFLEALQKQKVDPNRFMANLDTGSKIAASLAVAFGGIGAALTHDKNYAMENINRAINEDIQAQMNDQSKTMNLWKMNREAYGNDAHATLQTQNQMLQIAKAKAMSAAAQAQGPQAKAQALQPILQMDQQIASNQRMMALMDTGNQPGTPGMFNMDPAILVNQTVDPKQREQVLKEIGAAQDTKHMAKSIMQSFEDAAKENTILKTGFGKLRTPASVLSLHQSMQPTFKDLEGTVRQAAMDNTFHNVTPQPGDSEDTINYKRKALQSYLLSKMAAPTAKANGLDLSRFDSTNIQGALHQHQPGTVVSIKGKGNFMVAQDGNTLEPMQ